MYSENILLKNNKNINYSPHLEDIMGQSRINRKLNFYFLFQELQRDKN